MALGQIREAAQALLLAELRRIGPEGRKQVVDEWAPFLPTYADPTPTSFAEHQNVSSKDSYEDLELDDDDTGTVDVQVQMEGWRKWCNSVTAEHAHDVTCVWVAAAGKSRSEAVDSRRRQATAIVMLGVLGAEFGAEMEPSRRKPAAADGAEKKSVMDGFGLTKYSHSMHTSEYRIVPTVVFW